MKKILSLLALLVMTLTAFAADYTGHRTVTFGSMPSTESDDAVLTITDNGDNTFNVTFKDVINVDGNYTDNYGTFIFSNVAGTTENGVTTIDLSNLSASLENCALGLKEASDGVLFAKFNAEKAYAKFSAKIGSYYKSTISAEFGVNDFESTGGGSTGGDEKPAAFEKVDFVGDGTNFNWSIPVDWDTQKIVMSISTATCTTGCEHIIGLGVDGTSWAGNLHSYRLRSCVLSVRAQQHDHRSYTRSNGRLHLLSRLWLPSCVHRSARPHDRSHTVRHRLRRTVLCCRQ